jgi:hypothetical protein
MDHHVPQAITDALRHRGIDCLTALDDNTAALPDPELLARATRLGRVLFSMDVDLLKIAAEHLQAARPFAGLIYAHPLQLTIGQIIRDLELVDVVLETGEMANRVERLPL